MILPFPGPAFRKLRCRSARFPEVLPAAVRGAEDQVGVADELPEQEGRGRQAEHHVCSHRNRLGQRDRRHEEGPRDGEKHQPGGPQVS